VEQMMNERKNAVRMSLSIPNDLAVNIEELVKKQGFDNRSQAIAEILRDALVEVRRKNPDEVMAGSLTLFLDEIRPELRNKLTLIQRSYLKEVVGTLGVLLEYNKRMEVWVVQGPVRRLEDLLFEVRQLKGVETGHLLLTGAVLPQLHHKNEGDRS
jgi:CopG family nickel-responsive transcriptional regulator